MPGTNVARGSKADLTMPKGIAMNVRSQLYIDGKWVNPSDAESIEVVNPANEDVMGRVPSAKQADVDRAVSAARKALDSWSETPVEKRKEYLAKIHQGLLDRCEEIAVTITAEVGMPVKLSRQIQARLPATVMASYLSLIDDYPFSERIGNSLIVKEPVGVAACITPWNYPLHQVVAKLAPALAAGCTVVVKPSEVAPLSAFILAEIVDDAGLPPGVFNLVTGYGETAGEALSGHPEVDLVSFTGSLRAGRRVGELAAKAIKRVSLELGGKSASLILDDADLAGAVKGTVASCFINSGQTCSALTRMLVPEARYQEAAALAVEFAASYVPGDPTSDKTRLGPLVSAVQRARVLHYLRQGALEGAELLTGGADSVPASERGFFVQPTIFGRVTAGMTIAREEIFGPVLSIITYQDLDEAIGIANGTEYGLAAAVWSSDREKAMQVARRLQAGQVDINGAAFNPLAPFGGFKQSGRGRELGKYGLEEFLEVKAIQCKE
jgi:acyl-CoA reductase-like NAD-dependent aldehyde dehydrogenase